MPFRSHPGIEGKVFVPEETPRARQHPCPDCYTCQQCRQERCQVCRGGGSHGIHVAAGILSAPELEDGGCP